MNKSPHTATELLRMRFLVDGQKIYTAHRNDPMSDIALGGFLRGSVYGYQECLIDNKDRIFTIKDIEDAFDAGENLGMSFNVKTKEAYLESLVRRKIKTTEHGI